LGGAGIILTSTPTPGGKVEIPVNAGPIVDPNGEVHSG